MRKRSIGCALAAVLLFAGGCGDDSDSGTTATTTGGGGGGGEQAGGDEFCTAYSEMLAGSEPSADQIREVAAMAPEGAQEPLEAIADGFEDDPEGYFDSDEFSEAFAEAGAVVNEECADDTIEVTAVDYEFEGIPDEVEAGAIGITFINEGEEFHELAFMRKNDGVDESWDEILELEEAEAGELVTEIEGGSFAGPGGESAALVELAEPGEYVAICFIPVGTTPDAPDGGDGPPHYQEGMKTEFTVT